MPNKNISLSQSLYKHNPFGVRLFNFFGKNLALKTNLNEEKLLAKAQKNTGLQDFGDDSFREPFQKLLKAIDKEANLHPFGRMITRIRLLGILENKLRGQYFFSQNPKILEQEVDLPIVITGLQRTGTTMLHRLLASDEQTRALLSWEGLNPSPLLHKKNEQNLRIKKALNSEKGLKYIAPEFFAIHPVEHLAPEEEILLLDTSFISTVPEATMHVPSFASWVENISQKPAYLTMEKLLKLLQWQNKRERWVLKTPHHLEFLEDLFQVFPNSKVIQTHRHPVETIASFCSMVYHSRRIFSNEVSPKEIGQHWLRKASRMLKRAMEFRETNGNKNILDIYYQDLLQDPIQEVEKIYQFLDIKLTKKTKESMQKTLSQNKQHKYGKHQYRLEDFGLTEEKVEKEFEDYIKTFLK